MLLQWVDVAIIVIIGFSILTGVFRGFVKELIALCVWILAFWLAFRYCRSLDSWFIGYVKDESVRTAIGFVLILFATLLLGGLFNAFLSYVLRQSGLSGTDKLLGMIFGFIRGVFIVALLMLAIKMTSLPFEQYTKDSVLYARFQPVVDWLYAYFPQFIKKMKTVDKENSIIDTIPIE